MIESFIPLSDISAPLSTVIWLLVMSYIVGSIPFGLLLSKLAGHGDIRQHGSGNIGATNVLRVGGKKLAFLTLVLDGGKGAFAVFVTYDFVPEIVGTCALLAVMGHMFPIWLKFNGGKGVATTLAALMAISFPHGVFICLIWLLMAGLFRYSSLAALIAITFAPLAFHVALGGGERILPIILISTFVYIRHYQNIIRLLTGQESKIWDSKKRK